MRLSDTKLNLVRQTLRDADPHGRIWLFGSRVDDSRRGGDIDLYFEPSQQISLKTSLQLEWKLMSLCATKVDLLVRNPGQPQRPIHNIAKEGVLL